MNIAISNDVTTRPVLTADAIRKELPFVCKKDDGTFKSVKAIKNIVSGFNQMLKQGLLTESRLLEQMESEFKLTQSRVRNFSKANPKAKSWSSFLNDIRAAANSVANFDTTGMTFSDTLKVLAQREFGVHLSISKLCVELVKLEPSLARITVRDWLVSRRIPRNKKSVDSIRELDNKLNAKGCLTSKVKHSFLQKDVLGKAQVMPVPLPDALQEEIETYCAWRIHGTKPKKMSYLADTKAKTKAQKRKARQLEYVKLTEWQTDSRGLVSGEIKLKGIVQLFAKYLKECHPDRLDSFRLSTLFNHELFNGFYDYGRYRGILPSLLNTFSWLSSECGENTYVSVYLRSEDDDCEDIDDWLEELALLKTDLRRFIDQIKKNKEVLEGARNIEWVLYKENPFDYINSISDALWHNAEYASSSYAKSSVALLFDLLTACPIRAGNVCALQWKGELSDQEIYKLHKEHICAVYWDISKEHYVLFVHKQQLKNRKSRKVTSIIQPLPHLTDKIKQYLGSRSEHILGNRWSSVFFFVECRNAEDNDTKNPTHQRNDIWHLLSENTKSVIDLHFPEENVSYGINPHGMRHLMASLYLRYNYEDYTGLATLLMDDLSTVVGTYAKRADTANHIRIAQWIGGKTHA